MRLEIDTQYGLIAVVDEPTYTFTSQDNVRSYPRELRLSNDSLTSIHGLELDGHRVLVIGATGGRSAVHAHSAVAIDDKLYLAVGNRVACCVIAPSLELAWSTPVDKSIGWRILAKLVKTALYPS